MDKAGCGVLLPISSGVYRRVDYYGFVSFVICCALDFPHAYLAYHRSAVVDSLSLASVYRWIPYFFDNGLVHDLVEAFLPPQTRDPNGVLGVNRLYADQVVLWALSTAERCILASAVKYRRPPSQVDSEAVNSPS